MTALWELQVHLSLHDLFSGESVDDCGGGYSESIAEMCEELQNGLTPLLIVTPNGRDESGANRDCFLLNPAAKSSLHMSMFRFLGIMSSIIPGINPQKIITCIFISICMNDSYSLIIHLS